jgi:hypothetical protein
VPGELSHLPAAPANLHRLAAVAARPGLAEFLRPELGKQRAGATHPAVVDEVEHQSRLLAALERVNGADCAAADDDALIMQRRERGIGLSPVRRYDSDRPSGTCSWAPRGSSAAGQVHSQVPAGQAAALLGDRARQGDSRRVETAAVELAVGILLGLYQCRDAGSETLLEYDPDYAPERAADVVDRCQKLGVALPIAELFDVLPEWTTMLGRHAR